MPVVADFYTHLYAPEAVSVENQPLFDALNTLADTMRMRWQPEAGSREAVTQRTPRRGGTWLQFRSVSFYDDRLKEVPNRLLARWATARRSHGRLTLDDILEIAQLPDAPLDAASMAEGAKELWGLAEWDLACYKPQRQHLHFLSALSPAQRQEAMSDQGLPFSRMTLPQQQQFLAFALQHDDRPLRSLDELAGAALRIDYCLPGGFQWGGCDWSSATRWVVPLAPGPEGKRVPRPMARAATKAAALQALRRVDPQIREALRQALGRDDPRGAAAPASDEAQIFPTELNLTIVYIPGGTNARTVHVWFQNNDFSLGS
jgi:hypothetical protein